MKKTGKGLALLLAGVLLFASAAGCQKQGKQEFIKSENLMKNAQCVTDAGDKAPNGALSIKDKGSLTITFPQETELNTVVLREKGSNIVSFQMEAMVNGAFEKIYEQDKVEAYRYCAFPAVKTKQLKITVNQVREGKQAKLKSAEVYMVKNDASQQTRVTTYLIADRAYNKSTLDAGHFDTITDVILFGMTSFDENGNVIFNDAEIDGKKIDGKQVFEQALKNVRELSAARKTPLKIYVNFLGPSPKDSTGDWTKDMNLKADLHKKAMVDNGEKLIQGLTDFITTYEMEGLFFDYEYPLKKAQWTVFGDFLISLKEKMGSKILGTALSAWGVSLSQKAIDSIDLVEVMSYDSFDDDGNHSPFYSCGPEAIDFFVKRGFDKSRLDLGIPFYARPADSGGFWYDYSSEAQKLGKYGNKATGKADDEKDPCDTRYYNGYQMVYDKTAYAANSGVGGVMIWHYHCDLPSANELSLFGAMKHALNDRK